MKSAILCVAGCLLLCASLPAQDSHSELKGGGHALGETAAQFFSQGDVGDVLRACQARDWKTVSRLSRNADPSSKSKPKAICAIVTLAEKQAASGARLDYKGGGDHETLRTDTFTFDGGHLVKIDMIYRTTLADIEGYHPKSFAELLAGLQEAYGAATKTYTEPVINSYGIKDDARRSLWLRAQDAVILREQPGSNGSAELIAETLAEYNRAAQAPKAENPLQ